VLKTIFKMCVEGAKDELAELKDAVVQTFETIRDKVKGLGPHA
jgi:hypothetical protein